MLALMCRSTQPAIGGGGRSCLANGVAYDLQSSFVGKPCTDSRIYSEKSLVKLTKLRPLLTNFNQYVRCSAKFPTILSVL